MKKLFLIFFSILSIQTLKAQTTTAIDTANAPKFKFDNEFFDFENIPQGTPAKHDFVFTNVGKSPLIISNVQSSCGCVTPTWSSEPVMPGKTGKVSLTYNAAMPGAFTKSITAHSNASEPSKTLFVKGVVIAKVIDQTTPENPKNILNSKDSSQPK